MTASYIVLVGRVIKTGLKMLVKNNLNFIILYEKFFYKHLEFFCLDLKYLL